jgi:hypothetical protein
MPKQKIVFECEYCGSGFPARKAAEACEKEHKKKKNNALIEIKERIDECILEDIVWSAFSDNVCEYCDAELCHECPIDASSDLIEVFKKYPNTGLQDDIVKLAKRIEKELK